MPNKPNRIGRKLFGEILKKGMSCSGEFLYIKFITLSGEEKRYSFVVSKKISKKAVIRNLIKRRARHVIKNNLTSIKTGYAIVFFFNKKEVVGLSFNQIEQDILKVLKKARLC